MKKPLLLVALALVGVASYYWLYSKKSKGPAEVPSNTLPVMVSKYGDDFNKQIALTLDKYYLLSEKLVAWDSVGTTTAAEALQKEVVALPLDALTKDTAIYATAQTSISSLEHDFSILRSNQNFELRRRSFHSLSQNLYDFLRTIQYEGATIYLQECPMAFNDTETAIWLSAKKDIRNPYLGLHHPRYKGGMLSCGEVKDSMVYKGQNKGL